MTFLNTVLLGGVGSVSIPILIHLLMRRRVKRVRWAAMRFLAISIERNRRQLRVEDLLLLSLRCALLILLALALARPALNAGSAILGRGREVAVIAIDNSASMSQTDGVSSRFDQARVAADEIASLLAPESAASLFLVSDAAQALSPEPTTDLNLVRSKIRNASLSDRSTDLQPFFAEALDLLRNHAGAGKTIYLITDGQAAGWSHMAEIRAMLKAPNSDAQTAIVLVGGKETRNLGVSDLKIASALAAVDATLRFDIQVTNYGTEEARNIPVSLAADGGAADDDGVFDSIPSGASKILTLFAKFHDPGFHTVTARLPRDRVPADDQRTIALRVIDKANVLLVDGKPPEPGAASGTLFLRNALTPVPEADLDRFFIKTRTIAPIDLESVDLNSFAVVALANVDSLSENARASVRHFVEQGGGLFLFPGDLTDTGYYNSRLDFLPARFGPLRSAVGQDFFTLKAGDYAHPIVSIWRDPAAGALSTARFRRALALLPSATQGGAAPSVIISYSDGSPAVVEGAFGRGRIIEFSSTADTEWNDLPVRPVFVPLIQRMLGAVLAGQSSSLNIPVGGHFVFPCDSADLGKDVDFLAPGSPAPRHLRGKVREKNGAPLLQFDDTDRAGAYEALIRGEPPIRFATQANPEESRLEEEARLATLAPEARVVRAGHGDLLRDTIQRGGREFWAIVVSLAVAVACIESFVAARSSRSK